MSAGSVGEINLDLNVNQQQFRQQMSGIQGLAKKAGIALAAALSVKVLVDFGRSCVELGSDLAEVQNVVDVTFPKMTKQVSEFAQSAAASFGLSETMAKKFTGTFGVMAKSFGFSEQAAYDMSTALTGLSGDVASFYNLSQDEAYTKLKSVFTGETETLKDLGVVMTQSALDAYAMANGYGKVTAKMSEAEKVSLRYAFVQDQLTAAAGDFIRTSDGWANQVRILSLQFDSLKATIGQGLINVLTPVIKVINTIIGKLMVLANAFKSFTEMLTGKKSASSQISGAGNAAEESLDDAAGAADDLSDSTSGVGSAAKKAAKEMKALMGFDAINKLSDQSGGSGSGGAGSGGISAETDTGLDSGLLEDPVPKCKWLDEIKAKIDELTASWKNGFVAGIGDAGLRLEDIRNSIESMKQSIASIFTDNAVMGAANNFANSFSFAFGQIAGSVASIGITIAQNITGGIADYLQQNTDRIRQYLENMFDIGARISEMAGEFCEAFAYVFEALGAENGQKLTSNLLGMFSSAFMAVSELCWKLTQDIIGVVIQPFVDNKEGFRTALDGYLGVLAEICGTIKETIDNTFDKLMQVYDEHIKPFFDSVQNGLSELVAKFLEFWNTNVQPVMDSLAQKFDEVVTTHIQPMLNKFAELLGTVADALRVLWEQVIMPFVNWVIENILPVLLPIFEGIYTGFMECVGFIADLISGLITNIQGIIDFLIGVFTGDWDRAWKGIQEIVTGVMDQIKAIINLVITAVYTFISAQVSAIRASFEMHFKAIKNLVDNIMTGIRSKITDVMSGIKSGISNVLDNIKQKWESVWTSMKDTVIRIFNGIWSGIKSVINTIIGGIEKMANGVIGGINGVIDALNSLRIDVPDWVAAISGISGFGFSIPSIGNISIPKLAEGGYVRANTPQLAMIGDNRHQGEVVAPEDKLKEMAMLAVKEAGASGSVTREELRSIVDSAVIRIVSALYSLGFNIDGDQLAKAEKLVQKGMDRRYNTAEII